MPHYKNIALILVALLTTTSPSFATTSGDDPEVLIKDGKFFGEMRFRYENVEQDGFTKEANAHTIRTNIGYKTGIYKSFQALGEGQIVSGIARENYNSTTNGNTTFPVVADPSGAEINRLWLSWSGLPQTTIKIGRQALKLDNQRFIGTVSWRQNDQTFDAVTITNASIENLDLQYSYAQNVNRIFGGDNALGDLSSQIHIANASYKFDDWLKVSGYGYWLDFDRLAARSSETYGIRATGKAAINDDWTFSYEVEAATQEDHANNTTSYDENYYHISPSIKGKGATLTAGYESLGGDGTNAFQTPLATLHKFNGWADVFLNTPANGLEDFYASASYKVKGTDTILDGTKLEAVYHDFEAQNGGADFGDEIDLFIGKSFKLPDAGQPFKKINVILKYSDYDGDSGFASREKFWLQIGTKF